MTAPETVAFSAQALIHCSIAQDKMAGLHYTIVSFGTRRRSTSGAIAPLVADDDDIFDFQH